MAGPSVDAQLTRRTRMAEQGGPGVRGDTGKGRRMVVAYTRDSGLDENRRRSRWSLNTNFACIEGKGGLGGGIGREPQEAMPGT